MVKSMVEEDIYGLKLAYTKGIGFKIKGMEVENKQILMVSLTKATG